MDRGPGEKFGPDSGLCMSRSSDCTSIGSIIFFLPGSVFWCFVDYFIFSFKLLLHRALHTAVPELQPQTEVLGTLPFRLFLPSPCAVLGFVSHKYCWICNISKGGGESVCSVQKVFFSGYFRRSTEKCVMLSMAEIPEAWGHRVQGYF